MRSRLSDVAALFIPLVRVHAAVWPPQAGTPSTCGGSPRTPPSSAQAGSACVGPPVEVVDAVVTATVNLVAVCLDIYNKWPRKPKRRDGDGSLNPGA